MTLIWEAQLEHRLASGPTDVFGLPKHDIDMGGPVGAQFTLWAVVGPPPPSLARRKASCSGQALCVTCPFSAGATTD